nr:MAG TPA: hypothetical protein [Caudoviricetes sp.]
MKFWATRAIESATTPPTILNPVRKRAVGSPRRWVSRGWPAHPNPSGGACASSV